MKRYMIVGLMLLGLVCGLCGCKSDTVKAVEQQISEIAANTDNGSVAAARAAYDALSPKEQQSVANYDQLVDAEESYDKTFADNVTDLIAKIGTIDENSGAAIHQARDAYDQLTKSQRNLVTNFDSLISAEKEYDACMVKYCKELINSLNENAVSSEAIEAAVSAFASLSDAQKREVKNDISDPAQIIENAYIALTVSLISEIDYKSGMPSTKALHTMINAVTAYEDLDPEQKEKVTNSALLEKSLKAFKKFSDSRIKTDTRYAKQQYISQCQNVDYKTLIDYPKSSKGKQIMLKITIDRTESGFFSSSIQANVDGNTDKPVFLEDNRQVKEPTLKVGDVLTIYGAADGVEQVSITEENSGWFGSNFMSKKTGEYAVPVVKIIYTDQESPYESEHPADPQQEEMISELLQIISE